MALTATSKLPGTYWLVSTGATGSTPTIVQSVTKPAGEIVTQIAEKGATLQTFTSGLLAALTQLPSSVNIPTAWNVPGLGRITTSSDNPVSNAAGNAQNTIQSALSVADLFGQASTWKGVALCIAGGLLVLLGLLQLTGRDAKTVISTGAKAAAL